MSYYAGGTLFDALLECSTYVERARSDDALSRSDLLDGLESRVSVALGRLAAVPTCTSFCLFNHNESD